MAETTIEWAKYTFNPWEGCSRVSPGCVNCYAEARDRRLHGGKHWGILAPRKPMSDDYWKAPIAWNRKAQAAGVRENVFCGSLHDVFEWSHHEPEALAVQVDGRRRLGDMIRATPWLNKLLLTKRPENWKQAFEQMGLSTTEPTPGVWVGVTAEDQKRADERIPILLQIPAAKRFVSYEPALEGVNFKRIEINPPGSGGTVYLDALTGWACSAGGRWQAYAPIDQIIIGGESGPGARPFNEEWAARTILDCRAAGVAAFFKQYGQRAYRPALSEPRMTVPIWLKFKDKKGGDPSEWPPQFLVREYPV